MAKKVISAKKADSGAIETKPLEIIELVEKIEYIKKDFPEGILKEIIERKEEAVPVLLDILKKVTESPRDFVRKEDYFGHVYAIYLLSQFRVNEAYPLYMEMLRLPEGLLYNLLGDSTGESAGRILASLCGNDIQPMKEIIVDVKVDKYVRGQAVGALLILALHDIITRESALEYFRSLMKDEIWDKDDYVMAEVVSACNDLYPDEVIDDIRIVFDKDLVDDSIIDLKYVENTLNTGKEEFLDYIKKDDQHQFINNTIDELSGWACFDEGMNKVINNDQVNYEKVGPNSLCPCGSGRKYKKCCG